MRRALAALLVLAFALESAPALFGAETGSEDRLRRRVKRFYVLNYLNRYGEMWEMFSEDLRERLGGDRQDYVKSTRRSGFELYSSRIDGVQLKGQVAAVDVTVQAQLAGALDVTNRRHRMLWRWEDKDWRYAGSVDVTHDEAREQPVETAELQPPSRARAPEVEGQELLPARVRVSPTRKPESGPEETSASEVGERWDLVAVPPPGRENEPQPAGKKPAESAPQPDEPTGVPVRVAEAKPPGEPAPEETSRREWLPPERASAPPPPPEPPPGEGDRLPATGRDYDEGTLLVRKAVSGLMPRRMRALSKLRSLNDPRLASLMASALPDAPPATVEAFLAQMARYRAFHEADAAAAMLGHDAPAVRAAAARALAVLGGAEQAAALSTAIEGEGDDAARGDQLRAFVALAGDAAAPKLIAALSDGSAGPKTRAAAARSAGSVRVAGVEEALLALLRRERRADVARPGLLAAGRLGGEAALALLDEVAEGELRLPASTGDDLDGRLEARRGLALAGVPGSGQALAALLLDRGMRAFSEDVVLVASTGERDAMMSLLGHPEPAMRRRTAELLGRVIETDEDGSVALAAIEAALVAENDAITMDALLDARDRLRALPAS